MEYKQCSKTSHIRTYNFELSLFTLLFNEAFPVIRVLVLYTGSKNMPGKMIVDNLALNVSGNIVGPMFFG